MRKIISLILCFSFSLTQSGFAQGVAELNLGQYLGQMSNNLAVDKFRPLHLRYFSYDPAADNFQLLLDKGDNPNIKDKELEDKTKVLMEYFQIGIALPNDKFWVNLRPDAEDQIIDPELEKTDLGKIMLESDLQLKKDTANFTSPQTKEGKEYWDKLYQKAGELFGMVGNGRDRSLQIPTITRPWIVPGEIIVREGESSAYIFKANLKVMLEEDYLSSQPSAISSQQYNFKDPRMKELNSYSTQLIRELIIPTLTKEVNTAKRYAALRQVFFSLVLARWFKERFKGLSPQGTVPFLKLIDSRKLTDLTSKQPWSKTYYFNEYKKSFAQGEYNLKEQAVTPYGQVIRSYVSGGHNFTGKAGSPFILNRFSGQEGFFALGEILGKIGNFFRSWWIWRVEEKIGKASIITSVILTVPPEESPMLRIPTPSEVENTVYDYLKRLGIIGYSEKEKQYWVLKSWIHGEKFDISKAMSWSRYLDKQKAIKKATEIVLRQMRTGDIIVGIIAMPNISAGVKKSLENAEYDVYKERSRIAALGEGKYRVYDQYFREKYVDYFNRQEAIKQIRNTIPKIDGEMILKAIWKNLGIDNLYSGSSSLTPEQQMSKKFFNFLENFLSEIEDILEKLPEDRDQLLKKVSQNSTLLEEEKGIIKEMLQSFYSSFHERLSMLLRIKGIVPYSEDKKMSLQGKELREQISKFSKIFQETLDLLKQELGMVRKEKVNGLLDDIQEVHDNFFERILTWGLRLFSSYSKLQNGFTLLQEEINKSHPPDTNKSGSPLTQAIDNKKVSVLDKAGGIDFRAMQMLIQPIGSFSNLSLSLPTLSSSALERIDLDKELASLRQMASSGLSPSGQRVKEYEAALFQKGRFTEKQDELLVCLWEIYQLLEAEDKDTTPALNEALVIADTGRFVLLPNNQKVGLN